jgi:cephalosporin-C deacetylase-like acetyl esterase
MNDRRTFLQQVALLPFLRQLNAASSYGAEMPDMAVSYLSAKMNALAAEWDQKRALIDTPAELAQRNVFVRTKCIEMIHGLPARTPLDPVLVRTHERDGYRIECILFQSQPNFWVTASLYVPAGRGPFPGIVSPCGHTAAGRLYPPYQCIYMGLVKEGFVVLAYDPIGQGERRYFWNPATDRNEIGGPVTWEHSLPGQLLLLIGADLTHYRIWDGMRAIDYLLTRPEVDPQRIGCCGQSGGGTLTLFISALDKRVQCAAVHEGGTHHRWPVRIRPESWLGTGDVEQHFFPAATYGIDLCDLHVTIAPRPLLATIEHFNPGFQSVASHVKARYELLGVPEQFATAEAVDPHDMTMKLRLANTNWFCRWLQHRAGPEIEPDFHLETAADMNCTPNGSIRYSGRGDTMYSILHREQSNFPPESAVSKAEFEQSIRSLLRYRKSQNALAVRNVAMTSRRRYQIEKLEFLSEPGIYIPAWVFVPDQRGADRSAILYVSERGKEADGLEFGVLEELARRGNLVVAIDVRGVGETKPPHPDDGGLGTYRHVDDAETTMQYMAWEMNESLLGMRVQDLVRSVDYTLSRPDVDARAVRAIGRGMGALWVMFAAALDTRIAAAVCEGGLLSYRTLTESDRYLHGASVFIPDVLRHFDLPQVAAAVASRRLTVLAPVDAMKSPVDMERARKTYDYPARAYQQAGKPGAFAVAAHQHQTSLAEEYLRFLEG